MHSRWREQIVWRMRGRGQRPLSTGPTRIVPANPFRRRWLRKIDKYSRTSSRPRYTKIRKNESHSFVDPLGRMNSSRIYFSSELMGVGTIRPKSCRLWRPRTKWTPWRAIPSNYRRRHAAAARICDLCRSYYSIRRFVANCDGIFPMYQSRALEKSPRPYAVHRTRWVKGLQKNKNYRKKKTSTSSFHHWPAAMDFICSIYFHIFP